MVLRKIMKYSWNQQGHNDNNSFPLVIIVPKPINSPTISMNKNQRQLPGRFGRNGGFHFSPILNNSVIR